MFEEKMTYKGKRYRLVRRGTQTYRLGSVTLSYQPCNCAAMEKYRRQGHGFFDGPLGAVIEFPDGLRLLRDGHHRIVAQGRVTCERYIAERC